MKTKKEHIEKIIKECGIRTELESKLSSKYPTVVLNQNSNPLSLVHTRVVRGKVLTITADIEHEWASVIDDVKDHAIHTLNNQALAESLCLLMNKLKTKLYNESIRDDIKQLTDLGYYKTDKYIYWNDLVEIKFVIIDNLCYDLSSIDVYEKLDLGITQFRIEVRPEILDVECKGIHPHLNPFKENKFTYKKFCANLTNSAFNYKNVEYIRHSMSTANLDSCYLMHDYIPAFSKLISAHQLKGINHAS